MTQISTRVPLLPLLFTEMRKREVDFTFSFRRRAIFVQNYCTNLNGRVTLRETSFIIHFLTFSARSELKKKKGL